MNHDKTTTDDNGSTTPIEPSATDSPKPIHHSPERISTPSAILVATAFLLAAIVIMKAGELPANPAYAEASSLGSAGFSLVTARSGYGRDTRPYELLYLIDSRAEMMWVYEVDDAATRRVILRDGTSLPALFRAGRGR